MPNLMMGVLSDSSWENDLGDKKARYARIGVAEYWLFAPPELPIENLPVLQGFRLERQGYEAIAPVAAQVKGYATDRGTGRFMGHRCECQSAPVFASGERLVSLVQGRAAIVVVGAAATIVILNQ